MIFTPIRYSFILLAFSFAFTSNPISADQEIISTDGREILLKKDGSWAYRSNDRIANTTDGRRVRLKEDGSWKYIGHSPLVSKEQVRTTDLDIKLQKIVIEAHEKQAGKNTRVKTQTVFYFTLETSPLMKNNIKIKETDTSQIQVLDNNGKSYSVLSIQPNSMILKSGTKLSLTIRADKSPAFWANVKSMKIVLNPGIFGLENAISFEEKIVNIDKESVEGFEKIPR